MKLVKEIEASNWMGAEKFGGKFEAEEKWK